MTGNVAAVVIEAVVFGLCVCAIWGIAVCTNLEHRMRVYEASMISSATVMAGGQADRYTGADARRDLAEIRSRLDALEKKK